MTRSILFAAGVFFTAGVIGAAGATGCSSTSSTGDGGTATDSSTPTGDSSTPTGDSSTPTTDSSTGADSAVANPVVGNWLNGPVVSTSDAKQSTLKAYAFAADGTYAFNRVTDYPDGTGTTLQGCQVIRAVTGKYTTTGATVTITPTGGTATTKDCTDDTLDKAAAPIDSGDSDLAAQSGQITGNTLKVGDVDYTRQ